MEFAKFCFLLKNLGYRAEITSQNYQFICDAQTFQELGFYMNATDLDTLKPLIFKATTDLGTKPLRIQEVYHELDPKSPAYEMISSILHLVGVKEPNPYVYTNRNIDKDKTDVSYYYDLGKANHTAEIFTKLKVSEWVNVPRHNLTIRFDKKGLLEGYYHTFVMPVEEISKWVGDPVVTQVFDTTRASSLLMTRAASDYSDYPLVALGIQVPVTKDAMYPSATKFMYSFIGKGIPQAFLQAILDPSNVSTAGQCTEQDTQSAQ